MVCLKDLVVVCEKYDWTSALTPWSAIWLEAEIESLAVKDLDKLLFAAYILNNPGCVLKNFVGDCAGSGGAQC